MILCPYNVSSFYALSIILILALSLLLIAKSDPKSRKNWLPLIASLSLDLYSKWPELTDQSKEKEKQLSPLETEERSRRLLDLLWYPLRAPLYQSVTSEILDNVEGRLGSIGLLGPVVETIKIYRKLCENVYFYTSAS